MAKKMTKKALAEKQIKVATIYNTSIKSKDEVRAETESAIAKFLRSGGEVQVGRKPRARSGGKMIAKSSKGFQSGTSGIATGFPRTVSAFNK